VTTLTNCLPLVDPSKDNLGDSNLIRHLIMTFPSRPSIIESIFNTYLFKCQNMPGFLEICLTTLYAVAQMTAFDLKRSIFNYCKQVIGTLALVRQFALFCIQKVVYITLVRRPDLFKDAYTYSPFPVLALLLEELVPAHPIFMIAKNMYNEYRLVTIMVKLEMQTREKVKNVIYKSKDDEEEENDSNDSVRSLEEKGTEGKVTAEPSPDPSQPTNMTQRESRHSGHVYFKDTHDGSQSSKKTDHPRSTISKGGDTDRVHTHRTLFDSHKTFVEYFFPPPHDFPQMFHSLLFLPRVKIFGDALFTTYFSSYNAIETLFSYILEPLNSSMPDFFAENLVALEPTCLTTPLPIVFSNPSHTKGPIAFYKPEKHNRCLYRSSMTMAFLVKYSHHKQIFSIHKNYFIQFSSLISQQVLRKPAKPPEFLRPRSRHHPSRVLLRQRALSHAPENDLQQHPGAPP